jgi:hypothetical protein
MDVWAEWLWSKGGVDRHQHGSLAISEDAEYAKSHIRFNKQQDWAAIGR